MGRTEKLFRRLDELEAEYRTIAAAELRNYLVGSVSILHRHLFPETFRGKVRQNGECAHFEWLEKEIEALRSKFGEPLSDSPVGEMRSLLRRLEAERKSGGGLELLLTKTLLKQWGFES
ncbi:MAG TPA: hypothetical protein VN541_24780 [Tepidisphaeraceae bacterium]|nr:hypothetical protein [Tepidisphaeraceae bacterium]